LEDKDPEYRELFAPYLQKLTELKSMGTLKSVNTQIGKIIGCITGKEEEKKPALIPIATTSQQKIALLDIPLFDQLEEKPSAKLNAFTFMQDASPPKEEPKPDLFANLNLKATSSPPKSTAQSSFGFMKKEPEKKIGLLGIDFDFATTSVPAPKVTDALASFDFDTAFEPIENPSFSSSQSFAQSGMGQQASIYSQPKPQMINPQPFYDSNSRPQMPTTQQFYVPTVRPQVLSQAPLYKKEESETSKIDERYFGFVNDEL
jgi:hypothetical protein